MYTIDFKDPNGNTIISKLFNHFPYKEGETIIMNDYNYTKENNNFETVKFKIIKIEHNLTTIKKPDFKNKNVVNMDTRIIVTIKHIENETTLPYQNLEFREKILKEIKHCFNVKSSKGFCRFFIGSECSKCGAIAINLKLLGNREAGFYGKFDNNLISELIYIEEKNLEHYKKLKEQEC